MIQETVLEQLRSSKNPLQLIKPQTRSYTTNPKLAKTLSEQEFKKEQAMSKFKDSLLSINTSKYSGIKTFRESTCPKRQFLKSIKGGPLIPLIKGNVGRQQSQSQKISQSVPSIKQTPPINKWPSQIQNDITRKPQESLHVINQTETVQPEIQNQQIDEHNQNAQVTEREQNPQQVDQIQCMVQQYLTDQELLVQHLSGKCICVQCPCGRCRCKYQQMPFQKNLQNNSSYQTDFKLNPIKEQDLKLNWKLFNQFKSVEPCDYKTTMNADYKQFDIPVQESLKPKRDYHPALGQTPLSTYKNFYMDYGNLHYEQFKQGHYRTVIPELPFMSSTTYASNFKVAQSTSTRAQKPVNSKPFPTIDLFLGQSQSQKAYCPKKIERQQMAEVYNIRQ